MKKPRSGEIMRNRRCRVAKPTDNSTPKLALHRAALLAVS